MDVIASQITSLTIVYSIGYSGADQIKHQSSASLAFVQGIHRRPVNSPHKWPVTRKKFPLDDVIMKVLTYLPRLFQPQICRPNPYHTCPQVNLADVVVSWSTIVIWVDKTRNRFHAIQDVFTAE